MTDRVRLNLPDEMIWIDKKLGIKHEPEVQGMYLACQGRTGDVVCGAGNGGVFVRFDGDTSYVGCPARWLETV